MKYKSVIILIIVLGMLSVPVLAANDSLQMPSPVRGWKSAPEDAKTWAQTLLDWMAMIAGVIAIGSIVYYFIKGRVSDSSGSIQGRNDSTAKTIGAVLGIIILIVSIAFITAIFWK